MKPIIIDIQHMGKPHRSMDRGAVVGSLVESQLCLRYGSVLYDVLRAKGHPAFLLTHGSYGSRAAFANSVDAQLYLACHMNCFGQPDVAFRNISLIEISSLAGEETQIFANALLDEFGTMLPTSGTGLRVLSRNDRGYSCINRVRAPALLLEPLFMDHPDSALILHDKLYTIADCVYQTIVDFDWS